MKAYDFASENINDNAVKVTDEVNEKIAIETLFSYLDKGIDDMEAGRMHTVDEAFQIIGERMNNEFFRFRN